MSRIALPVAAVVAATALTACSFNFSVGGSKVKAADVQSKIATEIQAQTGKPAVVTCPNDLEGKVDATMTCTAAIEGRSYPVDVRVTEAKGKDVKYSWRLENTGPVGSPTPTRAPSSARPSSAPASPSSGASSATVTVTKDNVEAEIRRMVKDQTGQEGEVSCPGPLTGRVGQSMTCQIKLSGEQSASPYKVTVTRVEGTKVFFDVNKA